MLQHDNHWMDSDEIGSVCYAFGGHPKSVSFNFTAINNNSIPHTQTYELRATIVPLLKYGNHANW
jgi:hypothetical protein